MMDVLTLIIGATAINVLTGALLVYAAILNLRAARLNRKTAETLILLGEPDPMAKFVRDFAKARSERTP